jgi:hypothetical protein
MNIPSAVINNIANTNITHSTIHGHGLFSTKSFETGQELCLLDGQKIPWSIYSKKEGFSGEWNATTGDILVVRPFRTRYYYINHSRSPNLRVVENPLRIMTLRNIKAGEELLLDYRAEPLPDEYLKMHGSTYL